MKRKPGSKCAQIKQLKALLASLRQEGALQTSEFINTLLRNPACRTAAQSSATPESAYMAIATQALNNAAQNRESIENSRIASDGSARSWIGNKWYRLKRGVSNNSGKVATAVLIAACVALYYMYGAEAIQNATGQAFTSVKEYAAYLAAQTGEYLTKLRNYFSGSPPPSAQTPVEQGMTMMTPDQLAKQEAHAGFFKNVVNPARQNMLSAQKSNLKQAVPPPPDVVPVGRSMPMMAQQPTQTPALMPAINYSSMPPPSAQTVQAFQKNDWKFSPGQQLANEYALAQSSTDSKINTDYFWKKYEKLPLDEQGKYLKANKLNFGLIKGGASRNTTVKNRRKPARQAHRLAHEVRSPKLKRVLRKSSPLSPRRKAKPVTKKPANNASKSSKSPKSKQSNSNSPKSSHSMTLRKRT